MILLGLRSFTFSNHFSIPNNMGVVNPLKTLIIQHCSISDCLQNHRNTPQLVTKKYQIVYFFNRSKRPPVLLKRSHRKWYTVSVGRKGYSLLSPFSPRYLLPFGDRHLTGCLFPFFMPKINAPRNWRASINDSNMFGFLVDGLMIQQT